MSDHERANHSINKMVSIGELNKHLIDEAILYQGIGFFYLKLNDTKKGIERHNKYDLTLSAMSP
jgi:hypothetical protein